MAALALSYYNKIVASTIRNPNMMLCNILCLLIYIEFTVKISPGKGTLSIPAHLMNIDNCRWETNYEALIWRKCIMKVKEYKLHKNRKEKYFVEAASRLAVPKFGLYIRIAQGTVWNICQSPTYWLWCWRWLIFLAKSQQCTEFTVTWFSFKNYK